MTHPTSDAEDFADYTDEHFDKPPPEPARVERSHTPDVGDAPDFEPPD